MKRGGGGGALCVAGLVAQLALVLAACGGEDGAASDGATGAGAAGGCDDGLVPAPDGGCQPAEPLCAEGFRPAPDGVGCEAILPTAACAPGTMPSLGEETCRAVGWLDCPDGFTPDEGGWGCRDVLPGLACTGATLEMLGDAVCRPIGACAGTPHPDATLFVDAGFTDAELDATHFRSIQEAVDAAPSGTVIDVAAGDYVEIVTIAAPVHVAGRCAEEVILSPPVPGVEAGGVVADGASGVVVSGMTIRGHRPGVVAAGGAEVELEAVLVDESVDVGVVADGAGSRVSAVGCVVRASQKGPKADGWGAAAYDGAEIVLVDSALAGNRYVGVSVLGDGSVARLDGTIVRGTLAGGPSGYASGVSVQLGGRLEMDRSAVVENVGYGLYLDAGGVANVRGSIVRDTEPIASGTYGRGAEALDGSTLSLESSGIVGARELAVSLGGAGTAATIVDSVIVDTLENADGMFGVGISVQQGAKATVTRSAVAHSSYYGVFAAVGGSEVALSETLVQDVRMVQGIGRGLEIQSGASITAVASAIVRADTDGVVVSADLGPAFGRLERSVVLDTSGAAIFSRFGGAAEIVQSALVGNLDVGLYVSSSLAADGARGHVRLVDSVLSSTRPHESGDNGAGVMSGGEVVVERSTVAQNHGFGIVVASPGARGDVVDSVVRSTAAQPNGDLFGHGVAALDGAHLDVRGTRVYGNTRVGVVLSASSGLLVGSVIEANAVGLHVQFGTSLVETAAPAEAQPLELLVAEDTRFVDNGSRLGTGELPLPGGLTDEP